MKQKILRNQIIALSLFSFSVVVAASGGIADLFAAIPVLKSKLGAITGQTDSALHAYIGFAIFSSVAMAFRKPFHSMMPYLTVWGVELFNEFLDIQRSHLSFSHEFWANSLSDILYTVALPSAVFIIARLNHYFSQAAAGPVVNDGQAPAVRLRAHRAGNQQRKEWHHIRVNSGRAQLTTRRVEG